LVFVAPLVVVLCVLVEPGVARASGTLDRQLDQSQTDTSGGGSFIAGPDNALQGSLAQTFTAGVTGGLDRVGLYLDNGSATGPLTVEIRNTSGGAPGSTVLASASVPAASVTPSGGWVGVDFPSPAPVTSGTQYAIVAYTGDTGRKTFYQWFFSGSHPYAGGAMWSSPASPPTTWNDRGSSDLAFETNVEVPAADTIYWGNRDGDTLGFARLDGSGGGGLLNTSPVTPNTPDGLTIDSKTGRVYWANYGNGGGTTISFASLDGGSGGTLSASGATFSGPAGPVVDPAIGKIYWANFNNSTIEYANLNGGGGGKLKTEGAVVDKPNNVAIDTANGRIYWANSGNNTIYSAKLDNTGDGMQLKTGPASIALPNGIAIDVSTGKLYWANGGNNKHPIAWAKTNNSGTAANLDTTGAPADGAQGLALDHAGGKLYWANGINNTISFANLTGGAGGQLGAAGATPENPVFPVLLKAPTATAAPKISGGSTVGTKLSCSQGTWAPDLIGAFLYRQPLSFAYSWSLNAKPIKGATHKSTTASGPGSYTCAVTATNHAGSTKKTSAPRNVT
jgi:DNA-binding beta-propeller fold protein YncE